MKFHYHKNTWPWGESEHVIAEKDGYLGLVTVSFESENPGVAFISDLSVAPEIRRQGVATQLIKTCEHICEQRDIFRIDLNALRSSAVTEMYKKLGYKKVGEIDQWDKMSKIIKK